MPTLTSESDLSGDSLIECDCPPQRIERETFQLVPIEDGQNSWTRTRPRRFEKVPAVHHKWYDGAGQQWGVYHVLD